MEKDLPNRYRCAMTTDYDKLYAETTDALGAPTPRIVAAFEALPKARMRVLDMGCGQGRDALFIARRGHDVVGVDLSPNGIRDLRQVAARESLRIEGVVADLLTYTPEGLFDVILFDRSLHMLPRAARAACLARSLNYVAPGGWLFIADEPGNIPDLWEVISVHTAPWDTQTAHRGYLFLQRR